MTTPPRTTHRRVTIAAAATLVALSLTGCTTAASPAPTATPAAASKDDVVTQSRLSASAAQRVATAALDACVSDGAGFVTVAVVDRNNQLQALVRGDGAAEHTIAAAQQKAYTAAAFGAATSDLVERATGDAPSVRDLPGTLFVAGGVPITADGMAIAGVGVGGTPSGDRDQSCAQAGADALRGASSK